MQAIITDFSQSFVRLKVWQADGSYVETTSLGQKGVLYWARTKAGKVLCGIDRDGLDAIRSVLGELEQEERAAIVFALQGLRDLRLQQLEVEIDLTAEVAKYKIAYRNPAADVAVFEGFVAAELPVRLNRGTSQSL
ncbi:hypothetical protein [Rhizobium leguminosarum]|uniref:hypothetical protein n=1 Tax=Rhizobium leguminosarum TaxID=384 RepID=UPI00102F7304|nr:hypothetical protein [Rhizobium leguminosarum]TAY88085.1 hypothetical protein ELH83_09775 [Rhizobium leguminosarum]